MEHPANANSDIISPVPQRAYAFVSLFDGEEPVRPQSVPWAGAPGLVRPSSAPVTFSGETLSGGIGLIERPNSPLSRVTNPMVRDNLFRRGILGAEKVRKGRLPSPVASVNSSVAAE